MEVSRFAYTVHVIRRASGGEEAGVIEAVFVGPAAERDARRMASARSGDLGATGAVVTRFELNALGTRHVLVWFIGGQPHTLADRGPLPMLAPRALPDAVTSVL